MERDINSIVSYRQTITELAQDLIRLETYADKLDMDHCKQTLRQLNERIKGIVAREQELREQIDAIVADLEAWR